REVLTKKQRKISDREKKQKMDKSGGKKVMNEIRSFQKANLFDLGHPLINRIADSFVKASGISPHVYACYHMSCVEMCSCVEQMQETNCSILMHVTCCEVILLLEFQIWRPLSELCHKGLASSRGGCLVLCLGDHSR
ncbi:hypothetical protein HID58_029343, partial [Brassica napus]